MADAPKTGGGKPAGKPAPKSDKPAPAKKDPFIEIVIFLLGALLLVYLLNNVLATVTSSGFFSRGLYGLTQEGIIKRHTRPIASLDKPIGAKVVSIHDTKVFNSPGGKQVGTQKANARGRIVQGPIDVDGTRYWYVDYDTGPDGWVAEDDIGYLDSEISPVENLMLWMWSKLWLAKFISVLLTLLIIAWIAYIIIKLTAIRKNVRALLYPVPDSSLSAPPVNPKWQRILNHVESLNPGDWRLAIIEADIMLDDILNKLSLPGETMGDKLKAVEKSDFTTLDNAWEAHKIRNQIAHEGGDFALTEHEAHRVILLYKSVFDEFKII